MSTHGMHDSREYQAWADMKVRCKNPQHRSYHGYGGRGIKVCERWQKFENFYADMGPRPPGHSLDRINNDGNYEPANCRWATREQQNFNKRSNVFVTFNGETKLLKDWASETGIPYKTLAMRHFKGWETARMLRRPYLKGAVGCERRDSKLTWEQVCRIRASTLSQNALAKQYGVCRAVIQKVLKWETHKVPGFAA